MANTEYSTMNHRQRAPSTRIGAHRPHPWIGCIWNVATLFLASAITGAAFTTAAFAQKAPPGAATTLTNPGFEGAYVPIGAASPGTRGVATGEVAPGWQDNSGWADVRVTYGAETSDVHGGGVAQRITPTVVRSGAVQLIQPVHLTAGHIYSFSAWLKGQNGTTVELLVRKAGPPYTVYATRSVLLGGGWHRDDAAGVVLEDTDGFVMVRVTAASPAFLVDDAAFVDRTTTVSTGPIQQGNLVENGSFETVAGPDAVWRGGGWSVRFDGAGPPPTLYRFDYDDPRGHIDNRHAAVGESSLRLDIPAAGSVRLVSTGFPFNYGRPHAVSVALCADRPGVPVWVELEGAGVGHTYSVGTAWARYATVGVPTYSDGARFLLRVDNPGSVPETVWVDGAQVEERSSPSVDYVPAHPVELRVFTDRPGHIFFADEPILLTAALGTWHAPRSGARLRLQITDINGRTTALPDAALPMSPATGRAVTMMLRIPTHPSLGIWNVHAVVVGHDGRPLSAPTECVVAHLPRPREIRPTDSFFGVHIPLTPDYIALARAAGQRWVRLHDTSMIGKWATTEWTKGTFEYFDPGIDAAHRGGMAVLGMLDGAPLWASLHPRTEGYWDWWSIPDAPGATDAWSEYCSAVIGHYGSRISAWEVWNEPWGEWWTNSGNPNATPALYAELLRRAHAAAHTGGHDVPIIGIDSTAGDPWTDRALTGAGGPSAYDLFSFHLYNSALFGGPDAVPFSVAAEMNGAQKRAGGPSKPLWDTEGGPGDFQSFYDLQGGGLPVAAQASYMVRYDVVLMAAGARHAFVYSLPTDPEPGEITWRAIEYDRAIKPAIAARAVLAHYVDGAGAPLRSEPTPGLDVYCFPAQKRTGVVEVAWSYDGHSHPMRLPADTAAFDVWGNPLPRTTTIFIGTEPVYLIRSAAESIH
jgi:hypothetical protein